MENTDPTMHAQATRSAERRMDRAQEKAIEKAEQATDKVAVATGKVSKGLSDAAGKVDRPRVSEALRTTAQAAGRAEAQLRVKGARGMALGAAQWVKAHPERYLMLALGTGLFLRTVTQRSGQNHQLAEGSVVVMKVREIR